MLPCIALPGKFGRGPDAMPMRGGKARVVKLVDTADLKSADA